MAVEETINRLKTGLRGKRQPCSFLTKYILTDPCSRHYHAIGCATDCTLLALVVWARFSQR
jgi:hypothetical protein